MSESANEKQDEHAADGQTAGAVRKPYWRYLEFFVLYLLLYCAFAVGVERSGTLTAILRAYEVHSFWDSMIIWMAIAFPLNAYTLEKTLVSVAGPKARAVWIYFPACVLMSAVWFWAAAITVRVSWLLWVMFT